jgi:hypothetical protein
MRPTSDGFSSERLKPATHQGEIAVAKKAKAKLTPERSPPRKRKISSTAKALQGDRDELAGIKINVRKRVTEGKPLSATGKTAELESREIQMKIAALEKKAMETESSGEPSHTGTQKVRKQMQALRRHLRT